MGQLILFASLGRYLGGHNWASVPPDDPDLMQVPVKGRVNAEQDHRGPLDPAHLSWGTTLALKGLSRFWLHFPLSELQQWPRTGHTPQRCRGFYSRPCTKAKITVK